MRGGAEPDFSADNSEFALGGKTFDNELEVLSPADHDMSKWIWVTSCPLTLMLEGRYVPKEEDQEEESGKIALPGNGILPWLVMLLRYSDVTSQICSKASGAL